MNKKLMMAAVASALAIPGMAFAQSSVTVFGTIDAGVGNQSKVITATGTASKTEVTSQKRTSNRWGMKGSEDLGGGLKANFHLEGGYASDSGAMDNASGDIFHRGSWVGLSSGGNSVVLGYNYTTNFFTVKQFDPMSYTYTGTVPAAGSTAGTRSKNLVQGTVNFNGVTIMADWGMGEVPGNSGAGRHTAIGGWWSGNGLTIALATSSNADATNAGKQTDVDVGGAYKMNQFTFRAGLVNTKYDSTFAGATFEKTRLLMLGVQYDFSDRVSGRVGYYDTKDTAFSGGQDGKKKVTILGVDYNLSKSTVAYAELDHKSFKDADVSTTVGDLADGATNVSVGVMHAF